MNIGHVFIQIISSVALIGYTVWETVYTNPVCRVSPDTFDARHIQNQH